MRELREEAGLEAALSGLVGVYLSSGGINVVFRGNSAVTETSPGDDILTCEWMFPEQILSLPDEEILRPKKLRRIVSDALIGRNHPANVIQALDDEE